jgi:hypothetical protein
MKDDLEKSEEKDIEVHMISPQRSLHQQNSAETTVLKTDSDY